ncbi:hypothetical protein ACFL23_02165 [Patescibacteria group bacterium]
MIKVKPNIDHKSVCPQCHSTLLLDDILWQGIHICAKTHCSKCRINYVEDLKIAQAMFAGFKVDINNKLLYGPEYSKSWFGKALYDSLMNPSFDIKIETKIEQRKFSKNAIIINCIDFLYGHCLTKFLSTQYYLENYPNFSIILIIPKFLRWMVPEGVSETWTVNIPLNKKALKYYPQLDKKIKEECKRFNIIYVAKAFYLRTMSNISLFTKIQKHDFENRNYRITFIWREDRYWFRNKSFILLLKKLKLNKLILRLQNLKIKCLFKKIHKHLPEAKLTIAGLGKSTSFPSWIDDRRVVKFDEEKEKKLCKTYSESRLIIGVHGSNMMLPSAHAGMVIDLMPDDRWSNLAQDVIYNATEPIDYGIISWEYHYLPIDISIFSLTHIIKILITNINEAVLHANIMSNLKDVK